MKPSSTSKVAPIAALTVTVTKELIKSPRRCGGAMARPKTLPTLLKSLNGRHHAHGCSDCKLRYTDACRTSDVDGLCQDCRKSAHGRPVWEVNGDPHPCCYRDSIKATIEVRSAYELAGTRSWWKCRTCARTHPYQPVSVEEPAAVGGPE